MSKCGFTPDERKERLAEMGGCGVVMYENGSVTKDGFSGAALFPVGAEHIAENVVPWEEIDKAFRSGVVRVTSNGDIGTILSFYVYGSARGFLRAEGNNSSLVSSGNTVYRV